MTVGLGLLRLSPAAFWAMTPREFERATRLRAPAVPAPRRDDLVRLMRAFPDREEI